MTNNDDYNIALSRPDKNQYYLSVARVIATGSSCPPGKQHGCVAVKHCRIVATGYNGPPAGSPHCGIECPLDVFKAKYGRKNFSLCPAVHAEINCTITAAMIGTALEGAVFYLTKEPCQDCLKALKNLRLGAVIFFNDDDETWSILHGPAMTKKEELPYAG